MIRQTLLTACTLALLGCLPDASGLPHDIEASDDAKIAWLAANSVTVRSADAGDTDFSDLAPLRTAIGNARIVMLDEQSHGDGTAFAAKVRLIRFLHSEMGFDVLAFEAGMFDSREAWNRIRSGDDALAAVQQSIFGIWSRAEQVRPLFEYVAAHAASARPLELTGIDPQFTGPVGGGTGQFFADSLEAYLAANSPAMLAVPRWPAFRAVVSRIGRQYYRDTLATDAERDVFSELMPSVRLETSFIRLMRTRREHLFLDLRRSRQEDGQWLNSPLVARPMFYASNRAPWPTVFDAVFFSGLMSPALPVR